MFFGVASNIARTSTGALLEAMIEAGLIAKDQGFQHILFLSDSKVLTQSIKKENAFDWLDSTRLANFCFLNQNGLHYDVFWVPHVIVKDLWSVAIVAIRLMVK